MTKEQAIEKYKTEFQIIQKAFKNEDLIDSEEWELVSDMAYQSGLRLQGRIRVPNHEHGFFEFEDCEIDLYGKPDHMQVQNKTVYFLYF